MEDTTTTGITEISALDGETGLYCIDSDLEDCLIEVTCSTCSYIFNAPLKDIDGCIEDDIPNFCPNCGRKATRKVDISHTSIGAFVDSWLTATHQQIAIRTAIACGDKTLAFNLLNLAIKPELHKK